MSTFTRRAVLSRMPVSRRATMYTSCAAFALIAAQHGPASAQASPEETDPVLIEALEAPADAQRIGKRLRPRSDDFTNSREIDVDVDLFETDLLLGLPGDVRNIDYTVRGTGIAGRGGDDEIGNRADITVTADGALIMANGGVTLGDVLFDSAPGSLLVSAIGIDGGEGFDGLLNTGTITVRANSIGIQAAGVTPLLIAPADISLDATAVGIGMVGAPGPDSTGSRRVSLNSGTLNVTASATTGSAQARISGTGGPLVSDTLAQAVAIGMMGERGIASKLSNVGTINVAADAVGQITGLTYNLVDLGGAETNTVVQSDAIGMLGGSAEDTIQNAGTVEVRAGSVNNSENLGYTFLGLSSGSASQSSQANATAMAGRGGDDTLRLSGDASAEATSDIVSKGITFSVADASLLTGIVELIANTGGDGDTPNPPPPPQAVAIGLDGGIGDDTIEATLFSSIDVIADAKTISVPIGAGQAGISASVIGVVSEGERLASLDLLAKSEAFGIDGGEGDDLITAKGRINGRANALANQTAISLGIPYGLPDEASYLPGTNMIGAGAKSEATIAAIRGGDGVDVIEHSGEASVSADSTAVAIGATIDIPEIGSESEQLDTGLAITFADTAAEALADAAGIDGGTASDYIENSGALDVSAKTLANSTGFTFNVNPEGGDGFNIQVMAARGTAKSEAFSRGIDAGDADDTVANIDTGSIAALANADVIVVLKNIAVSQMDKGLGVGGALIEADGIALADARGIAGGWGDDVLTSAGSIDVDANSGVDISSGNLDINIVGDAGVAGTVSAASSKAKADSVAIGVDGGEGRDQIYHLGEITADSMARAFLSDVAIAGSLGGKGLSGSVGLIDLSANAKASSDGIAAAEYVQNSGTIAAIADAEATSLALNVQFAHQDGPGVGLTAVAAKSGAQSEAVASGITLAQEGGTLVSTGGSINAEAHSLASKTSGSLVISVGEKGIGAGATLSDSSVLSTAAATAVLASGGAQQVVLDGSSGALAEATAENTGASINFTSVQSGVALGANLLRAGTGAAANAAVVETGDGADFLLLNGAFNAQARTELSAAEVTVTAALAPKGVSAAGALINTAANGAATAYLARTSGGDDDIRLGEGFSFALAETESTLDSVSVTLSATSTGLSLAGSLLDSTHTASTFAGGIEAGDGDDSITSSRSMMVVSSAKPNSNSVSVNIAAAGTGVGAAASLIQAETLGLASASGLEGGLGDDSIISAGSLNVIALSQAEGVSFSLDVAAALKGPALAASIVDASVVADSVATGIAGDQASRAGAGESSASAAGGADTFFIFGDVNSVANATSKTFGLQLPIPVSPIGIGVAVADLSSTASARATGVDAGAGDDTLLDLGLFNPTIIASANATAIWTSIQATQGLTLGEGATTADAEAIGVNLGAGDDSASLATIIASATTTTEAVDVSARTLGAGISDSLVTSRASATGVAAGLGDDVVSVDTVEARANAKDNATIVSASLAGAELPNGTVDVAPFAVGIDGGDGSDRIYVRGATDARATGALTGTNVAATLLGASITNSALSLNSHARGLEGGEGDDRIVAGGKVSAAASASMTAVDVAAQLLGASFTDQKNRDALTFGASSTAVAVSSGAGNDSVSIIRGFDANATVTSQNTSVSAGLIGYAQPSASATLSADATGIELGDGADSALAFGAGEISASATNSSTLVGVNLAGAVVAKLTNGVEASATGFDLGDGTDTLNADMELMVTAKADGAGFSLGGTIAGADVGSQQLASLASATLIESAAGDNTLMVAGRYDVAATSTLDLDDYDLTFAGVGQSKLALTSDAYGKGVVLGSGSDLLLLDAALRVSSDASIDINTVGIVPFGLTNFKFEANANAFALGIDTGAGDDLVKLTNALNVFATGQIDSIDLQINLAGNSVRKGTLFSELDATGVLLGEGDDVFVSSAIMNVETALDVDATGTSFSLFGAQSDRPTLGYTLNSLGIDAGAGDDRLAISNLTRVASSLTYKAGKASVQIAGATTNAPALATETRSVGIRLGEGTDELDHTGMLEVAATTDVTASNEAVEIFGGVAGRPSFGAYSFAQGVDGSLSTGLVRINAATIDAKAASTFTGGDVAIFGATANTAVLGSEAEARGFNFLLGDVFHSVGAIDISAEATTKFTSDAEVIFGEDAQNPKTSANAAASGVVSLLGDGNLYLISDRMSVRSLAILNADGDSRVGIGSSSTRSAFSATATSTGLHTVLGSSRFAINDTLDVFAGTGMVLDGSSSTFIGSSNISQSATATASALGIRAFLGSDVTVSGHLEVVAFTNLMAEAGRTGGDGGSQNTQDITVSATSTGITTGLGDSRALIQGSMSIDAVAKATSVFTGNSTSNYDNDLLESEASGTARATGIDFDLGSHVAVLDGDLTVTATGTVFSKATLEGRSSNTDRDLKTIARAYQNDQAATGMDLDGLRSYALVNEGSLLTVSAVGTAQTETLADGAGDFGFGSTAGRAEIKNARAVGISADAAIELTNDGSIVVAASPRAIIDARADSDLTGSRADAKAFVEMGGILAAGVIGGYLDDVVLNSGLIDVDARPVTEVFAYATADEVTLADQKTRVEIDVNAMGIAAYGVLTGLDCDFVFNAETGKIEVVARPEFYLRAYSEAKGSGAFVSTSDNEIRLNYSASAYGVNTGSEADIVVNHGYLSAEAAAFGFRDREVAYRAPGIRNFKTVWEGTSRSWGVHTGLDNDFVLNTGSIAAYAFDITEVIKDTDGNIATQPGIYTSFATGIETGDGNDIVINEGQITASAYLVKWDEIARDAPDGTSRFFVLNNQDEEKRTLTRAVGISTGAGDDILLNSGSIAVFGDDRIAIDMGSGNDRLILEQGTYIEDTVRLGSGDDIVQMSGDLETSQVSFWGGTGSDMVLLTGAGSADAKLFLDFEELVKVGTGTFRLGGSGFNTPFSFNKIKDIAVYEGALEIDSFAFVMPTDGSFTTLIDGDGTGGLLTFTNAPTLGGTFRVLTGTTPFSDGQSIDVFSAPDTNRYFDTYELPKDTALLSFSLEPRFGERQTLAIVANVEGLETVAANNAFDRAFAEQLDIYTSRLSGYLQQVVYRFQQAPEGYDFASDIAALNPAGLANAIAPAADANATFQDALDARSANLAFVGDDVDGRAGLLQLHQTDGLSPVGSWNASSFGPGFVPGSHAIGSDVRLGYGQALGFAVARSGTSGTRGGNVQREGSSFAFYGAHRLDQSTALSWTIGSGATEPTIYEAAVARDLPKAANRFLSLHVASHQPWLGGVAQLGGGMKFDNHTVSEMSRTGEWASSVAQQDYSGMRVGFSAGQKWTIKQEGFKLDLGLGAEYERRLDFSNATMLAELEGLEFRLPLFRNGKDELDLRVMATLQLDNGLSISVAGEREMLSQYDADNRSTVDVRFRF